MVFLVEDTANDPATKESEELQKLASLFREHSIENVLEISNLGDEISKWGAIPDKAQTLIPQLCRFLTSINEVCMFAMCVCMYVCVRVWALSTASILFCRTLRTM